MMYWEFIDGYYLSERGVDLSKLFQTYDPYRTFNMLDSILVEDGIRMVRDERAYEEARNAVMKVYGKAEADKGAGFTDDEIENMYGTRSDYSKPVKPMLPVIEPTENGYPGLAAPLG